MSIEKRQLPVGGMACSSGSATVITTATVTSAHSAATSTPAVATRGDAGGRTKEKALSITGPTAVSSSARQNLPLVAQSITHILAQTSHSVTVQCDCFDLIRKGAAA